MMQMFFFTSGFDSASRAHFRPLSIQRFVYFNKNEHFVTHLKSVLGPIGVSGLNHLFEHIFMMKMFSFNFGFWFGF